ncbi:hypothetical protein [Parahaliea mediterranea]|uniref:hypothetical protein n=1 Tax=Parahaliea mediterranea TaxID=651086 RepID=UPI000E2ED505|nr:hypothetical protein [Parahaliea mediterranea]
MTLFFNIFAMLLLVLGSFSAFMASVVNYEWPVLRRVVLGVGGVAGFALFLTITVQTLRDRESDWREYALANNCTVQQLTSKRETSVGVAPVVTTSGSVGAAIVPSSKNAGYAVWFCENTGETHVRKIR